MARERRRHAGAISGAALLPLLLLLLALQAAGAAGHGSDDHIDIFSVPHNHARLPTLLRGMQRALLQDPNSPAGYSPTIPDPVTQSPPPPDQQSPSPPDQQSPADQQQSPPLASSPQPGSSPAPLSSQPPANSTNNRSASSSKGGLSPTVKKAAIIGAIVGVAILVIIAVGIYVYCSRGSTLKAPPLVAAYGKTDHPHATANFDLHVADTAMPPDGAATACMVPIKIVHHDSGTRHANDVVTISPPPSWRLDAAQGAAAAAAAGGLVGAGTRRGGRSSANSSMENVLAHGNSQSLMSVESTASMSSLHSAAPSTHSAATARSTTYSSTTAAPSTRSATPSGMHRTSTAGTESLPSASMQPPRLPAMPLNLVQHGGGVGALTPGARGMMGGGGTGGVGRGHAAPAGGGPDPLMAVMGYGALMVCTTLAREILEAGDRVVANHARCRRIVTRVRLMQPLLLRLQKVLQGPNAPDDIEPMLEHIQDVYADCRTTVLKWCDNAGSWVQVVKNMVRSRAFQDEFVDLNERLSNCYSDLTLALNINQADVAAGARTIEPKEAEEDLREDLQELASELMSRGWGELGAEEQTLVKELYAQHGLDLDQLLKQAKKVWQEDKIKDLRVPWSQLQLLEEVGSGGYGTVFRARWAGSEVAVKKLSATAVTERVRKELEREAYIMSTLFHPNVARFYGVVVEHPNYALVMQYYSHGTLLQLLQSDSLELPWQQRYRLAHDIAQGMRYLHSRPVEAIVHGDLKSSNLLIDPEGRVVITDFGLAKVKTTTKTIAPGAGGVSACYCAPELLNAVTVRRTPACDVYSYGMILFEIATREMPFEGLDINLIYNHVRQGVRPDIPESIPQAFTELIRWCWAQKPADRPTFDQVVDRLNSFLDAAPLE